MLPFQYCYFNLKTGSIYLPKISWHFRQTVFDTKYNYLIYFLIIHLALKYWPKIIRWSIIHIFLFTIFFLSNVELFYCSITHLISRTFLASILLKKLIIFVFTCSKIIYIYAYNSYNYIFVYISIEIRWLVSEIKILNSYPNNFFNLFVQIYFKN